MKELRNGAHWKDELYRQRMTTKQWREILLNKDDHCTFRGRVRILIAKSLGCGVMEVYKSKEGSKIIGGLNERGSLV